MSFAVVYRSATTIKLKAIAGSIANPERMTAWILKGDGSTLAADVAGQNLTGPTTEVVTTPVFDGLYQEIVDAQSQSLYSDPSQGFHSTGTTSVAIGTNAVTVTNYAANSLPEFLSACGTVSTYTAFSLSVGMPSGTTFPIATSFHFAGTSGVNTSPTPFDVGFQVTDFTVA
jgi:hypothetical protein